MNKSDSKSKSNSKSNESSNSLNKIYEDILNNEKNLQKLRKEATKYYTEQKPPPEYYKNLYKDIKTNIGKGEQLAELKNLTKPKHQSSEVSKATHTHIDTTPINKTIQIKKTKSNNLLGNLFDKLFSRKSRKIGTLGGKRKTKRRTLKKHRKTKSKK